MTEKTLLTVVIVLIGLMLSGCIEDGARTADVLMILQAVA
ncbi:MAG: hypothetical protein C5S47_00340 [Candidatus Methanogasteraceae archaeon]|nr:MAG: hypothetical protein C5S47_00340 [ANME-2 cluster archaeon]